ncbi:endonuclease [Bacillus sp. FJAT-29953]|nr:endonuclease [Bacillus sp. FJAT-29953]
MSKKKKVIKDSTSNFFDLHKQLAFLRDNKRKIREDKDLYYDETQDLLDIEKYYQIIAQHDLDGTTLFYKYNELLTKTHKNRIPYFISKDLYLYTWVDLHPDGSVKSIYSSEKKNPETIIIQDYQIITEKYEEFQEFLRKIKQKEFETLHQLKAYERKLKVNTEHIVPQSWFGALEPMKGDLHHLFVCDPECNITRSNFPYSDLPNFHPESPEELVQNNCGLAVGGRFEPEHGKGTAARAMLYFLLRYPKAIKKAFRIEIDLSTLIKWHKTFPVGLYEMHRNQTIYHIQGNRNPFIDFSELTEQIEFPIH